MTDCPKRVAGPCNYVAGKCVFCGGATKGTGTGRKKTARGFQISYNFRRKR